MNDIVRILGNSDIVHYINKAKVTITKKRDELRTSLDILKGTANIVKTYDFDDGYRVIIERGFAIQDIPLNESPVAVFAVHTEYTTTVVVNGETITHIHSA